MPNRITLKSLILVSIMCFLLAISICIIMPDSNVANAEGETNVSSIDLTSTLDMDKKQYVIDDDPVFSTTGEVSLNAGNIDNVDIIKSLCIYRGSKEAISVNILLRPKEGYIFDKDCEVKVYDDNSQERLDYSYEYIKSEITIGDLPITIGDIVITYDVGYIVTYFSEYDEYANFYEEYYKKGETLTLEENPGDFRNDNYNNKIIEKWKKDNIEYDFEAEFTVNQNMSFEAVWNTGATLITEISFSQEPTDYTITIVDSNEVVTIDRPFILSENQDNITIVNSLGTDLETYLGVAIIRVPYGYYFDPNNITINGITDYFSPMYVNNGYYIDTLLEYAPNIANCVKLGDYLFFARLSYILSYYDNNGDDGDDGYTDEFIKYTDEFLVPDYMFTTQIPEGKVFCGWNTDDDGSGWTFLPGETYFLGREDVNLYAIWSDEPLDQENFYSGAYVLESDLTLDDDLILDFNTVSVINLNGHSLNFNGYSIICAGRLLILDSQNKCVNILFQLSHEDGTKWYNYYGDIMITGDTLLGPLSISSRNDVYSNDYCKEISIYKTGDENETVSIVDGSFYLPNYNITIYALFSNKTEIDEVEVIAPTDYTIDNQGKITFNKAFDVVDSSLIDVIESITISENECIGTMILIRAKEAFCFAMNVDVSGCTTGICQIKNICTIFDLNYFSSLFTKQILPFDCAIMIQLGFCVGYSETNEHQTMDSKIYKSGEKVVVKGNEYNYTNPKHYFSGWINDHTGDLYLPGETFIVSENCAFSPYWLDSVSIFKQPTNNDLSFVVSDYSATYQWYKVDSKVTLISDSDVEDISSTDKNMAIYGEESGKWTFFYDTYIKHYALKINKFSKDGILSFDLPKNNDLMVIIRFVDLNTSGFGDYSINNQYHFEHNQTYSDLANGKTVRFEVVGETDYLLIIEAYKKSTYTPTSLTIKNLGYITYDNFTYNESNKLDGKTSNTLIDDPSYFGYYICVAKNGADYTLESDIVYLGDRIVSVSNDGKTFVVNNSKDTTYQWYSADYKEKAEDVLITNDGWTIVGNITDGAGNFNYQDYFEIYSSEWEIELKKGQKLSFDFDSIDSDVDYIIIEVIERNDNLCYYQSTMHYIRDFSSKFEYILKQNCDCISVEFAAHCYYGGFLPIDIKNATLEDTSYDTSRALDNETKSTLQGSYEYGTYYCVATTNGEKFISDIVAYKPLYIEDDDYGYFVPNEQDVDANWHRVNYKASSELEYITPSDVTSSRYVNFNIYTYFWETTSDNSYLFLRLIKGAQIAIKKVDANVELNLLIEADINHNRKEYIINDSEWHYISIDITDWYRINLSSDNKVFIKANLEEVILGDIVYTGYKFDDTGLLGTFMPVIETTGVKLYGGIVSLNPRIIKEPTKEDPSIIVLTNEEYEIEYRWYADIDGKHIYLKNEKTNTLKGNYPAGEYYCEVYANGKYCDCSNNFVLGALDISTNYDTSEINVSVDDGVNVSYKWYYSERKDIKTYEITPNYQMNIMENISYNSDKDIWYLSNQNSIRVVDDFYVGEKVILKIKCADAEKVCLSVYDNNDEFYYFDTESGNNCEYSYDDVTKYHTFIYSIQEAGSYAFYVYCGKDEWNEFLNYELNIFVEVYDWEIVLLENETSNKLSNYDKRAGWYFCEIKIGDLVYQSSWFNANDRIVSQPSVENDYTAEVIVEDEEILRYQWVKVSKTTEEVNPLIIDNHNNLHFEYYLNEGETIIIEMSSQNAEGIRCYRTDGKNIYEQAKTLIYEYTADHFTHCEFFMTAIINGNYTSTFDSVVVKINKTTYTKVEGQNSKTLKATEDGNYALYVHTYRDNIISDTISYCCHSYGDVTYTWSNDLTKCTASVACSKCNYVKIVEVDVVAKITQARTVDNEEKTTYTATFNDSLFETQVKVVKTNEKLSVYQIKKYLDKDAQTFETINIIEGETFETLYKADTLPTKEGYRFDGWYKENNVEKVLATDKVLENISLYAKWSILKYSIKFNSDGGSFISEMFIEYGDNVVAPDNPTKDGYHFVKWTQNGNDFTFPKTMPANDISLVAVWIKHNMNEFKSAVLDIQQATGSKKLNKISSALTYYYSLTDSDKALVSEEYAKLVEYIDEYNEKVNVINQDQEDLFNTMLLSLFGGIGLAVILAYIIKMRLM